MPEVYDRKKVLTVSLKIVWSFIQYSNYQILKLKSVLVSQQNKIKYETIIWVTLHWNVQAHSVHSHGKKVRSELKSYSMLIFIKLQSQLGTKMFQKLSKKTTQLSNILSP